MRGSRARFASERARLNRSRCLAEQCVGEFFRAERLQILDLLADADEIHRNRTLPCDRGENTALRRAVEFGDDQAGEAERVMAAKMPPLAVPSSFVTIKPVSDSASSNAFT